MLFLFCLFKSQEKTAFVTPQELYEFKVMPLGLTNAPDVCQGLMQRVLQGINPVSGPDFISGYIDDMLVFSATLEEHLEHLRQVITRMKNVGLKLQPTKCRFVRKEVRYLGHVITPEGLKPDLRLVEASEDFLPQSIFMMFAVFLDQQPTTGNSFPGLQKSPSLSTSLPVKVQSTSGQKSAIQHS